MTNLGIQHWEESPVHGEGFADVAEHRELFDIAQIYRGLKLEVILLPIDGADIFTQIFQNIQSTVVECSRD